MAKPLEVGDASSLEEVNKAYEASRECHDRERLLAIRLAHQGRHTLEQMGSILKRSRATIARWLKAYREGGKEELLERGHGGGPKASLSQADQEALIQNLLSGCWKRARDIQICPRESGGWNRPEAQWCLLLVR